jgi:DNA modification methylase
MRIPVQAATAIAARAGGGRTPKTVRVVFRSRNGAVGKRDYLTHWIHAYPAKMFHRIPQVILGQLPKEPQLRILDPFCGSGTVLLEALVRGHQAIGIDVNPMARLISKVKVTPLSPDKVRRILPSLLQRSRDLVTRCEPDSTLDFWFKRSPRESLEAIIRGISDITSVAKRDFFRVCLSSVVRKASLADPAIPPPVKLTADRLSVANERYKKNLKASQSMTGPKVFGLFERAVEQNLLRMQELNSLECLGSATIMEGNAEAAASPIDSNSVDLVITSPPYCGAQKYVRTLRLEMLILGISRETISDADRRTLGTERLSTSLLNEEFDSSPQALRLYKAIRRTNLTRASMFAQYVQYLDRFATELARVLKPTGEAFVTFGTDRMAGIDVDCAKLFAAAATAQGMSHIATLVDTIPSHGMITNRHSSASTIRDERVVWIRRT